LQLGSFWGVFAEIFFLSKNSKKQFFRFDFVASIFFSQKIFFLGYFFQKKQITSKKMTVFLQKKFPKK